MIYTDEININELNEHLKNLPDYFVMLIISEPEKYEDTNIEILKALCNEEKLSGLYITFAHPYSSLFKTLSNGGINMSKLFFIDLVTKTKEDKPERTENCLFISSPKKISDLGVAIDEALHASKNSKKFLFVDSVSALSLCNSLGTVKKFEHFLTIRMRLGNLTGILISLNGGTEKEIIPFLVQFCDKVIKVH